MDKTAPEAGGIAPRRKTHAVAAAWGGKEVIIGGGAPVAVQSMTNTLTEDADATARQAAELAEAGSELVRITVATPEAAEAVPRIREKLDAMGVSVPLVGDFHYNGHLLLTRHPACAEALSKYRINPGNVGPGGKRDARFAAMVETACRYGKPVRIGVNWGSMDQSVFDRLKEENERLENPLPFRRVTQEALVVSALESAERARSLGLPENRIVLSCKVSDVQDLIAVYRTLSARSSYALHLGLTEAGGGTKGIVGSAAALAVLLQEGIGDTIRISLTPGPGESRTKEVLVAQELLQTMGMRQFAPLVVSCPGCGRTSSDRFQKLADETQKFLREKMPEWRGRYPGVESMCVAVMGCIVNGPGESRHADIGISLPGSGESPAVPVFADGARLATLKGENIAGQFQEMILEYVKKRYTK